LWINFDKTSWNMTFYIFVFSDLTFILQVIIDPFFFGVVFNYVQC